ncbi:hypothetical protein BYT27DRAFT_7085892 [Phlegmacium glaucopus]|nr:hypothetical protein BYT27DRAFT_7085892 [Phlegmacium glaucopus]
MAPSAYWTAPEELSLINFLIDHRAEAGDGANFKATTFQKAAKHLAPLLEHGAPKNAKSCGNKYCAFRKLFHVIRVIQSISGWSWNDETGASIDVHTASSWDDYVKVHPEAKPFQNKGWPYFRKMETLMPATVAGANVYHATTAPPPLPAAAAPSSIDSDDGSNGEEQSNETSDAEEVRH